MVAFNVAQDTIKELRQMGNISRTIKETLHRTLHPNTSMLWKKKFKALKSQHLTYMSLANNLRSYFKILELDVKQREHCIKQLEVSLAVKEDKRTDIVDDTVTHKYTQYTLVTKCMNELE